MQRFCLVLILLYFALFQGLVSLVLAGDPQKEQQVRDWLTLKIKEKQPVRDEKEGIHLKWETITTTRLSAEEINQRWKKVEPYPDHPERDILEYHLQLLQEPSIIKGELWYAGSGAWMGIEDRDKGSSLQYGGVSNTRWMLFTSGKADQQAISSGTESITQRHLTIIRAGKPYPDHRDVSHYLDESRKLLALTGYLGLPVISQTSLIDQVEIRGNTWSAYLRPTPDSEPIVRISGTFFRKTGEPAVSTIDFGDSVHYIFSNYKYHSLLLHPYPKKVIFDRPDSVRETYYFISIDPVSRQEVVETAALPDADTVTSISDFRDETDSELLRTRKSDQEIWTITDSGDHYQPVSSPEIVSANAPLPVSENSSPNNSITKLLSTIFTIVVILLIPIVIYFRRQSLH